MLSLLYHPAATAFGLTLLHALWQAALVAGFVALLHTQLTSSRLRYATALGGLLLLPVLAVATFYHYYTPLAPATAVDASQWLFLLDATGPEAVETATPTDWRSGLPYLTAIYLLGLSLFVLQLAGAGLRLYFLRRRGIHSVDATWQERMTALNRHYGIRPAAKLFLSARVDQVLSFGHFKPLILLPIGLLNQLTPAEVEAILLHELAHLQRRDYLWNWLQSAVETAYFFHPAVYWLGRRIRHERECCCDDWVAQRTDKTIYAQSLIHLARFAQTPTNQLAMYANSSRSPLGQRIERLFQPAARRRSLLPLLLLLIPFALLAWRPLQQSVIDESSPEKLIISDDRPAEAGNEILALGDLEPGLFYPAEVPPAAEKPERRDRAPAAVSTLIPRELTLLPVTEGRISRPFFSTTFGSLPTLDREVSPLITPAPIPAADTIPNREKAFHPETLFIIDGKRLPRTGNDPLEKLDPEDILSVNVYKGTSAVDKYGDEGQNGVVVITTRRKKPNRSQSADSPIDPAQKKEIHLRSAAGQGAEPRYVIDGDLLPADQSLDLEPDNIESITVWKDESATQRYGAAGANGVIEIQTKTGVAQDTPAPDAPIHLDADDKQTEIRIRSSEQRQPLFVIDGEQQPKGTGKPANLSPEEIESVEVLKGAAAVERFGNDGVDGVILIQTKAPGDSRKRSAAPRESKKLRFVPDGIPLGDLPPVYLIDGEIQPDARAVENLNKEDIEQINVIKDEPARAVYGEEIGDRAVIDIRLKGSAAAPPPPPAASPAPTAQPATAPRYLSSTLYPNPTSGKTQISFTLESEAPVTLDVFDARGRRVRSQPFGRLPAGTQQLEFDAADLPAGTYTVTILAGNSRWKATLVRP